MASVFKDQNNGEKASSLDAPQTVDTAKASRAKKKREGRRSGFSKGQKPYLSLIADIALIVCIVGIIVGAYFGIRTLQRMFAPAAEAKEITFRIALPEVLPESVPYNKDGSCAIIDKPVWFTDLAEGDKIGTVKSVDFKLNINEGGRDTVNVYVTVTAKAVYRDSTYPGGAGYYMGGTRIVGGLSGVFRMNGLVAEGEIVNVMLTDDVESVTTGGHVVESADDESTTTEAATTTKATEAAKTEEDTTSANTDAETTTSAQTTAAESGDSTASDTVTGAASETDSVSEADSSTVTEEESTEAEITEPADTTEPNAA
ncbi:MAG: hypothetical protein E7589_03745 [Ruminococcaceae bacterium]|nr:hypothetical protein [Oscillospiraceae bacterium]